jgi:hypothetical protein
VPARGLPAAASAAAAAACVPKTKLKPQDEPAAGSGAAAPCTAACAAACGCPAKFSCCRSASLKLSASLLALPPSLSASAGPLKFNRACRSSATVAGPGLAAGTGAAEVAVEESGASRALAAAGAMPPKGVDASASEEPG